jgi:hypothetical protein
MLSCGSFSGVKPQVRDVRNLKIDIPRNVQPYTDAHLIQASYM